MKSLFLAQELRSVDNYLKILKVIAGGNTRINDITHKAGINHTGTTTKYLDILQKLDIVEKDICFGKKNIKKLFILSKINFLIFPFVLLKFIKHKKLLCQGIIFIKR
ncbi:hypothetical protein [Candidatus Phytoplasma luffae]|uniref:hypothetical protein n=1 Tax=Loofah witches'-broom phytoplasma TaxID=35773 RepID=UPI001B367AA7|nr:hypothetical protein [Candidatus Phytoplasma luffae]